MGLIGRVLSYVEKPFGAAVTVDPGGRRDLTAEHTTPPGDDSAPLPGDYVQTASARQAGRQTAVGYVDPKNPRTSAPGEKRLYARDTGGETVAEIKLLGDGSISVENGAGSFTLAPDGMLAAKTGDVQITVAPSGIIQGKNSVGSFTLNAAGAFTATAAGGLMQLTSGGNFFAQTPGGGAIVLVGAICTINGVNIQGGDVIAGGISLMTHTHTGSLFAPVGPVTNTGLPQ